MKRLLPLLLVTTTGLSANELSTNWDMTLSASHQTYRSSPWSGEPVESESQSLDAVIDVEVNWKEWTALIAAKGENLISNKYGAEYKGELVIQELFYQNWLDIGDYSIDYTIGKVRLDWGVGYGYRPLDIFKPYRRNPVGVQVEEGAGTLLASYFSADAEWSVVYTDSSWVDQQASELSQATQQQGIGLRRYALMGDYEWQWVAYYDDVRHGLVGSTLVGVLGSTTAFHLSGLYQRHYQAFEIQDSYSPVSLQQSDHGYQALAGVNWSSASGQTVIAEYWFDSRSWDKNDWDKARQRAQTLRTSPVTSRLASSYARGYGNYNLVQHNLLVHWTLDSSAWSQWDWSKSYLWLSDVTPTLDVMISPQDGGVSVTQWLKYNSYDSGDASLEMEVAARFYGGNSESAYSSIGDKYMILFNIKGKF
ncbi:hypothetical protein [Vibrio sonorensis]|uniref:hypothetical protein n=1 Tax=Vibrio sonorensis TaxID=1004316 RepID=UPI0008D9B9C8|nr:hypothetical protein [Vibrio sonorensis]